MVMTRMIDTTREKASWKMMRNIDLGFHLDMSKHMGVLDLYY
jgi:hypothetical protein